MYNVIDSRDRNERGEAKLCRGISTIIRIISPELGGRMAGQIKLPSEFEFHRCIFARIASVHTFASPRRLFPREKGVKILERARNEIETSRDNERVTLIRRWGRWFVGVIS